MHKPTDVRVQATELFFLPVTTRIPLKFGPETLTSVTCARARVQVRNGRGRTAWGWGETPLSVQWVWPSRTSYALRHERLQAFCRELGRAWAAFPGSGHALEVGWDFQSQVLPGLLAQFNRTASSETGAEAMPFLAALVCCSVFDQALHDAYGQLHQCPVYDTYSPEFLSRDLAAYCEPSPGAPVSFEGAYPSDFLRRRAPERLRAWHLVGGLDLLEPGELTGNEPRDGYPVLLGDWIRRDGLQCLKVKLRGNDAEWDYHRLVAVGNLAAGLGVECLSADFNCTVQEPAYVNGVLDRLLIEAPELYRMILYVEQPFPYELVEHPIDVRSVAGRRPLFLDESAHDWRMVRYGRELGWTGVALKTCKTQTGAIVTACWSKAHGMPLMVQDLTNPMLAQIPHVLLAAHCGTVMGVETNAMQFYPEASAPEAAVHPGLYQRREGSVSLRSIQGPGFGYRVEAIRRELPAASGAWGMV